MPDEQPNLFEIESAVVEHHRSGAKAALDKFQKDHSIQVHHANHLSAVESPWIAIIPMLEHWEMDIAEIMAEACSLYDQKNLIGEGRTRRDAIKDLCQKRGIVYP